MDIAQQQQDDCGLLYTLEGKLDTLTAPELDDRLKDIGPDVKELTLDLAGLSYLSSAGLRVILGS